MCICTQYTYLDGLWQAGEVERARARVAAVEGARVRAYVALVVVPVRGTTSPNTAGTSATIVHRKRV